MDCEEVWVRTTFNNILAISNLPVLVVEYSKKTTGLPQVTDKLYHMLYRLRGFKFTTLVVIGTDCIGSCKSNKLPYVH